MENPEYLKEMNEKVQKLQNYRYMLNCGSITNSEYTSLKDQILFGECEGYSACNHIGMGEAYSGLNEGKETNLRTVALLCPICLAIPPVTDHTK